MNTVRGGVIVLVCVSGGYILEQGNLHVLCQPVELLIIGGAALGAFVTQSPGNVVRLTMGSLKNLVAKKCPGKEDFMNLLGLLFDLLSRARREGIISLEKEIEEPDKSAIFTKYPRILADKPLMAFLCENFKMLVMGIPPAELIELVEIDLEARETEAKVPAESLTKIADALPGLGIVAAVLGVVITMGKISEPPEVLGHSIGAALVGTFLGILGSYGFVGPMATNLEHQAKQRQIFFSIIRTAIQHFDSNPMVTVEIARREIPVNLRPSDKEVEELRKKQA